MQQRSSAEIRDLSEWIDLLMPKWKLERRLDKRSMKSSNAIFVRFKMELSRIPASRK